MLLNLFHQNLSEDISGIVMGILITYINYSKKNFKLYYLTNILK